MERLSIDEILLDAAEKYDKQLNSKRFARLRQSYLFFENAGLSDDEIRITMGLTFFEFNKVCKSPL